MTVTPEVSNIDSKDSQTIAGDTFEANVYAIRRMTTSVIIPNGNTLVMGGLMSNTETDQSTKVPLLGDLPGPLGLLFRRDSKSKQKSNLIIFITPTIVQDYDYHFTPTDYLRNSLKPSETPQVWEDSADATVGFMDSGKPASKLKKSK